MRRLLLALTLFAPLSGCAKASIPISAEPSDDGGPPLDTVVMAYLSEARALHHQANLAEDERDLAGATRPLERLIVAETPHPGTRIPEVEEVLADTFARLAELRARMGDLAGAERDAKKGLSHATEPTYFRGHLLEVEGIVEESRAASLVDAGRPAEADRARSRARELLGMAVAVQERVLSRSTSDASSSAHVPRNPDGGLP